MNAVTLIEAPLERDAGDPAIRLHPDDDVVIARRHPDVGQLLGHRRARSRTTSAVT